MTISKPIIIIIHSKTIAIAAILRINCVDVVVFFVGFILIDNPSIHNYQFMRMLSQCVILLCDSDDTFISVKIHISVRSDTIILYCSII